MNAQEIRDRLEAAGHEVRFSPDGVMRHVLLDPVDPVRDGATAFRGRPL
jgi:hypothetical protein